MGSLKYLGVANVEIINDDHKIFIDPLLKDSVVPNPYCDLGVDDIGKLDLILVTHGSYDHLGSAIPLTKKTGATLVGARDVVTKAISEGVSKEKTKRVTQGVKHDLGWVCIKAVRAEHVSFTDYGSSFLTGVSLGYIINFPNSDARIYHMGDTAIFGDLKLIAELYKPNIILIPIGMFPGAITEMEPWEAAIAVSWLNPTVAIPIHYDKETQKEYPEIFKKEVKRLAPETQIITLNIGDQYHF
ncbi:MAG: hypothetical protein VR72_01500 [Clostridiaceae bacterium BRH_c20a]|nr:MAG: hypothetical protein VR72_01500 [Clostridiaceae bacterium BRH_c20a]